MTIVTLLEGIFLEAQARVCSTQAKVCWSQAVIRTFAWAI
jgi:hypothetical protein